MRVWPGLSLVFLGATLACGTVTESGGGRAPDAGDGGRVRCDFDQHCPIDQPVCDLSVGLCGPCSENGQCDWRAGTTRCETGSGACVACTANPQCVLGDATVCDDEEFVCRGCESNDECESGLCDIERSACVDPGEIIWVEHLSGNTQPCGQRNNPCPTITEGFAAAGGLTPSNALNRRYVVLIPVAAEPYPGSVPAYNIPERTYVFAEGADFGDAFQAIAGGIETVWVGGEFLAVKGEVITPLLCSSGQLRVRNVDIQNYAGAITADDCDLEVYDSRIRNTDSGISTDDVSSTKVERNRFTQNSSAISANSLGSILIRSNLFKDNGTAGSGAMLYVNASEVASVSYNTFVGNLAESGELLACDNTGTYIVSSNIARGDDLGIGCSGDVNFDLTVENNIMQVDAPPPGNSNVDPQFVDESGGDYRLGPNSPAIDQGTLFDAPPLDVDGLSRSAGDGPDIGAFERN